MGSIPAEGNKKALTVFYPFCGAEFPLSSKARQEIGVSSRSIAQQCVRNRKLEIPACPSEALAKEGRGDSLNFEDALFHIFRNGRVVREYH